MNGTTEQRAKLLRTIGLALEALAGDCETIRNRNVAELVDYAAALNGIAQRAEKIADCAKARLWNIKPLGGDLAGGAYRATLVSTSRATVDIVAMREAYPDKVKQFTNDAPLHQIHFAPK